MARATGRARGGIRLALFAVAATIVYLTHLLAFVLPGVLVVSYELFGRAHPWRTPLRDWVVLAGQPLQGLVLWSASSIKLPGAGRGIHYMLVAPMWALEAPFQFRGAYGLAWADAVAACLLRNRALPGHSAGLVGVAPDAGLSGAGLAGS